MEINPTSLTVFALARVYMISEAERSYYMVKSVLKGKRILAVDDEFDILEVLREELERLGVELDTAGSYEDAIQKMHSLTYDLAILDIMGVRGFELLQYASSREIPAVMLTACKRQAKRDPLGIEKGAHLVEKKPHCFFFLDILCLNR